MDRRSPGVADAVSAPGGEDAVRRPRPASGAVGRGADARGPRAAAGAGADAAGAGAERAGAPGERERLPLRERKKRRTHQTIARVALELFDAQGFRATTIAQIADAADVSPRTVSTYFPAKEDLVFPDADAALAGLATALRSRLPGEYAVDALRRWIADEFVPGDAASRDVERVRRRVIDSDEALRAYEHRIMDRAAQLLRAEIARDLGTSADDVAAQLAGAAAVAALGAISAAHAARSEPDEPAASRDAALALLDQAIAFLRGGIAELRAHRGEGAGGRPSGAGG